MPATLKLDVDEWDLTLDTAGNIVTTTGAYAIAQNVANAVRLFTDDAYYEPERGIPHFLLSLGENVDESVVRARVNAMALAVDGVASADTEIDGVTDRELTGTVSITTDDGEIADVAL